MTIIITMAGLGSRFTKVGYTCPKYMIEAKGKTLFEWSMLSLLDYNKEVNHYVFVVRKEHNTKDFIVSKMNEIGNFEIDVVEIDYLTSGQAETALLGIDRCKDNESILIFNIDTYIEPYNLKLSDLNGDGHIPCFHAKGNHWSFVKEENGKVIEVVEKKRISDNCSLGVYYFKSAELYRKIYYEFYDCNHDGKERYIAPMYNYMLKKGYEVTYSTINCNVVHVLGTPDELTMFVSAI